MKLHGAQSTHFQAKLLGILVLPYQPLQENPGFCISQVKKQTQSCLKLYSYWVVTPGSQTQVSFPPQPMLFSPCHLLPNYIKPLCDHPIPAPSPLARSRFIQCYEFCLAMQCCNYLGMYILDKLQSASETPAHQHHFLLI